jgi:multicomponent Na+:H+ antiporter subunit C
MSTPLLFALTGVLLWGIGLLGLIGLRHLLRKLLALNVISSATFLILVGLAQHHGGPDPVPQALALTGIVVSIAATALGIVLIRRYYHLTGSTALESTVSEEGHGGEGRSHE